MTPLAQLIAYPYLKIGNIYSVMHEGKSYYARVIAIDTEKVILQTTTKILNMSIYKFDGALPVSPDKINEAKTELL